MRRFKNILFATQAGVNEKSVLARAMDLARSNQATLTVFDVVEDIQTNFTDPEIVQQMNPYQDRLHKERYRQLDLLVNAVTAKYPDVPISIKVRAGRAFIEIIRAVQNEKHDLVMKVREENKGARQFVFGSTDFKLMRKCPCPVWIIKPTYRKRFTRILAAVDPDPINPESPDRLIMDIATSLAETEKSELYVVHAWQLKYESMLRGSLIPKQELNELIKGMQLANRHQLNVLLNHYSTHKKTALLIKGSPGEIIPNIVREKDIDLIVMGTVGRTGIAGLIIGNTAEKILNTVDCSVLTVKPEGFKFPV
jgi:universal stress protein E